MGCLMQTTMLIAQNNAPLRDMGAATGAATFLRNMGGSLGVSLLGSVYVSTLTDSVASHGGMATGAGHPASVSQMTPEALRNLPEAVRQVFQEAVSDGASAVFTWGAVVAVAGLLIALFIRHTPLRGFEATDRVDTSAKPGPALDDSDQEAAAAGS
jgi:hypothetical protein